MGTGKWVLSPLIFRAMNVHRGEGAGERSIEMIAINICIQGIAVVVETNRALNDLAARIGFSLLENLDYRIGHI